MKPWWVAAFGVAGGLLGAGLILLICSRPRGVPVNLLPAPTPAPLVVHVAGQVSRPGVYSLPVGARVLEAVQAAGGLLPGADPAAVNLAAPLQDGRQIVLPALRPTPAPPPAGERSAPAILIPPSASSPIHLNTATAEELEALPGIGPALAQAILSYRQEHGPFASLEALDEVPGIGPATIENLRELLIVED